MPQAKIRTEDIVDSQVTVQKIGATGVPDGTTVLHGNGTWQVPSGGGGGLTILSDYSPVAEDVTTLNFATTVSLSDLGAGQVYIAPLGGSSQWTTDTNGITYSSNIGINTPSDATYDLSLLGTFKFQKDANAANIRTSTSAHGGLVIETAGTGTTATAAIQTTDGTGSSNLYMMNKTATASTGGMWINYDASTANTHIYGINGGRIVFTHASASKYFSVGTDGIYKIGALTTSTPKTGTRLYIEDNAQINGTLYLGTGTAENTASVIFDNPGDSYTTHRVGNTSNAFKVGFNITTQVYEIISMGLNAGAGASSFSVDRNTGLTKINYGLTLAGIGTGTATDVLYIDGSGIVTRGAAPGGGPGGGITRSVLNISSTTTGAAAASTDYVYMASGTFIYTQPTAGSNTNRYTIKNIGTGTITIQFTSGQSADGDTELYLLSGDSIDLISNGSNWFIVAIA